MPSRQPAGRRRYIRGSRALPWILGTRTQTQRSVMAVMQNSEATKCQLPALELALST